MKFTEVLDALMEGKPITRTSWQNKYLYYDKDDEVFVYHYVKDNEDSEDSEDNELMTWGLDLIPSDLIADDWDIDYWDTEFTYFWDRFEELFAKEWMSKEYSEDCSLLCDFLTKNYPRDLSLPKVYAVEDSIILEWNIDDNDISLDIKVNILQAVFHTYNHKTKEQEEFIIDLVEDHSWNEIFNNLKNL